MLLCEKISQTYNKQKLPCHPDKSRTLIIWKTCKIQPCASNKLVFRTTWYLSYIIHNYPAKQDFSSPELPFFFFFSSFRCLKISFLGASLSRCPLDISSNSLHSFFIKINSTFNHTLGRLLLQNPFSAPLHSPGVFSIAPLINSQLPNFQNSWSN